MPIFLVLYTYKMLPNGYGIKEVRRVIPTTMEKVHNEINKCKEEMYMYNMQCDYWARHDESVLASAVQGGINV